MLELNDLSLITGSGDTAHIVLNEVCATFPEGQFSAILGPSAAGNFALFEVIAGISKASGGSFRWKSDSSPCQVGLIPDANFIHDYLTVRESIAGALDMQVAGISPKTRKDLIESILLEIGLVNVSETQARFLSPEQRTRLKLGKELVTDPKILLMENITKDLAPRSETEILRLLRQIATDRKCTILLAQSNLRHLDLFDSLLILQEGHLAYQGPGEFLFHYFNIQNPEELFPRLAQRKASEWHSSWAKHREAYLSAQTDGYQVIKSSEEEPELPDEKPSTSKDSQSDGASAKEGPIRSAPEKVSGAAQFLVLLSRQWKGLFRNRTLLLTQLTILLGLPCLVILSSWAGLSILLIPTATTTAAAGVVVSQLAMVQAILVAFAGMINGASEIAGERALLEKEKFDGLCPFSYVAGKAVFLAGLAATQSLWMALFVRQICHFPGNLVAQFFLLFCVNSAMTAICLGISAFSISPDKAKLAALYLVALQFPLSGGILALPDLASQITRLLNTAYWGWSGFLQTLGSQYELGVQLKSGGIPLLLAQMLLGLVIALLGVRRSPARRF